MLWKRTRHPIRVNDDLQIPRTAAGDDNDQFWNYTRGRPVREYNEDVPDQEADTGESDQHVFMDGKVLMVDQLWLWIVDSKTVVTFFPHQESATPEEKLLYEHMNLYKSIYNELNGDLARRFETAGDLAALIVLHAVNVLLDRTLQHDLQVLRIFEESISILVFASLSLSLSLSLF